jgi:hypothetical protein
MADAPHTWSSFWPYYLGEHRSPLNQLLHACGSLLGLGWLGLAVAWGNPWLVLAGLVNGYALAWIGHFLVEKNRPATFRYPLKSFVSDWRLLALVLTGRAGRAVAALDATPTVAASADGGRTPAGVR